MCVGEDQLVKTRLYVADATFLSKQHFWIRIDQGATNDYSHTTVNAVNTVVAVNTMLLW